MRSPAGVDLLTAVGAVMETMTGWPSPEPDRPASNVTFAQFVDVLMARDLAETTAVLHVVRAFTDDDVLRARIDSEVAGRRQPMPSVVAGLADIRATQGWLLSDLLRDVDSVIVGIDGPYGTPRSCVVQVHHDVAAITDAFLSHETADQVRGRFEERFEVGDVHGLVQPLSPADARAHIESALEFGALQLPPIETDTWPHIRPFLRFLCRTLPSDGRGYAVDFLEDEVLDQIVEDIITSDAARAARLKPEWNSWDRTVLATMVEFASSAGFAEPWRWSLRRVDELLSWWLPLTVPWLLRDPDRLLTILRVAITEAGRHEGLPRREIAESLGAVDALAGHFRRRADEVVAGLPDDEDEFADEFDDQLDDESAGESEGESEGDDYEEGAAAAAQRGAEYRAARLADLEAMLGGSDALSALTTDDIAPLRLEVLDLGRVPPQLHQIVTKIDGLASDAINALADPRVAEEYHAAVRVLLGRVSQLAAGTVRRAPAARTAAALCWAVGRANDLVREDGLPEMWRVVMRAGAQVPPDEAFEPSAVTLTQLIRTLGVRPNVTVRAVALLEETDLSPVRLSHAGYALGDPALLTANKRWRIAVERDLLTRRPGRSGS